MEECETNTIACWFDSGTKNRHGFLYFQCFVFNLYQGVRAGGGLGDVIEPADGDDSEAWRILFDISFFFFIIVILLAIIQGKTFLLFTEKFKPLNENV